MAQLLKNAIPMLMNNASVDLPADITIGGSTVAALGVVTSSSANAIAVGPTGATNPTFNIDASTGSAASGLNLVAGTTSGTVGLSVISTGTNTSLTIDGKGSGTVKINNTSTTSGLVTIGNSTALGGLFVNGPLSGNRKVLASSGNTTLTAAMSGAVMLQDTISGETFTLPTPVVGMQYDFVVSLSCTSNSHKVITSAGSVFLAGAITGAVDDTAVKSWVGDGATHVAVTQSAANSNAKGGLIGSWTRFVAVSTTLWIVSGLTVAGGTPTTPFATS